MNPLTRLYDGVTYTLMKWWIKRKFKQFRKCATWQREWRAILAFYDPIWEA